MTNVYANFRLEKQLIVVKSRDSKKETRGEGKNFQHFEKKFKTFRLIMTRQTCAICLVRRGGGEGRRGSRARSVEFNSAVYGCPYSDGVD